MTIKPFKAALAKTTSMTRKLIADNSGVALTEFALITPVFLALGVLGLDTANYVVTHMRISQVALHVADNASRVGELDVLVSRKVFEDDINDVFIGAAQYADGLNIADNGRIILSSLEENPAKDGQWIHWQRCYGAKDYDSTSGTEGDGENDSSFPGMGPAGREITASSGDAVMFAEVAYTYESISPFSVLDGNEIVYTGSFNVRDARDLTQIYQTDPVAPVADCD